MNEFSNDNGVDQTVDRLLQQAFAGRSSGSGGRASLVDVRQRARRHQRRRAGAVVGAAAVVGIGGVAAVSQRSDGAVTSAPGDESGPSVSVSTSTSTSEAVDPVDVVVRVALVDGTPLCWIAVAGIETPGSTPSTPSTPSTIAAEPIGALETIDGDPVIPCLPPDQVRCHGTGVLDDGGYTTFTDCETLTQIGTYEAVAGPTSDTP